MERKGRIGEATLYGGKARARSCKMSASIRHLSNEKHSKIEYSSDYEIKLLLDINLTETEWREFAYIR